MPDPTIFVVDDDHAVRKAMRLLMKSVDLSVETYASAEEFLAGYDKDRSGCLVVDVRMPGISGLELQKELLVRRIEIPVIFISGHGDIPVATRALKAGARDFVQKPFSDEDLLERIKEAIEFDAQMRLARAEHARLQQRLASLTGREREVLDLITHGSTNRQVALALGISEKTVEKYRGRVMDKMAAGSVAELVRMVLINEQ